MVDILRDKGVPEDKLDEFLNHAYRLFNNTAVLDRMAKEASTNFNVMIQLEGEGNIDAAADFGTALVQDWAMSGMSRLSPSSIREMMGYTARAFPMLPSSQCVDMLRGTMSASDMAKVEVDIISPLTGAEVSRYLSLVREAVVAEIEDSPVVIPLNSTEIIFSEKAIEEEFLGHLFAHPRSEALAMASDMSEGALDADVCEVGIMFLESALSIEGTVGDWSMRYLSQL